MQKGVGKIIGGGIQNSESNKVKLWIFVIIALVIVVGIFTPEKKSIDLSKAKPYSIFHEGDFSFPGRKRMEWWVISPEAKSFEERAQTAIKAAIDLQKKSNADMVSIWLEINPILAGTSNQFAVVRYAPDGAGFSGIKKVDNWIWEVEATGDIPDQQAVTMAELWYQNRPSFLLSNGLTDEPKLKAAIAKKLKIKTDQVGLKLWFQRKPYQVQY